MKEAAFMEKPAVSSRFFLRLMFYLAGLFLIASGIVLSLNSRFGISPVSSLPKMLNRISLAYDTLPDLPLSVCLPLTFCIYIVLQILILRKDYKWINLCQIIFSWAIGWFVSVAQIVFGSITAESILGRALMLAVSIVLIGIGVSLYVDAKLLPMPSEGLALAISQKSGGRLKFHNVKVAVDCSIVGSAILVGILFLGGFSGFWHTIVLDEGIIHIGTVLSAMLVGKVVGVAQKFVKPFMDKTCFPQKV